LRKREGPPLPSQNTVGENCFPVITSFDALPTAVKDGLRKKAGKGKVTKVESLTKRGKLVAYEAKVMTEGNKSEVQVGPGGEALDHEE